MFHSHNFVLPGLIRKLATMKVGKAIRARDSRSRVDAEEFLFLHQAEMNDVISSQARQTLQERKFNQKEYLPLTRDLVKLALHQVKRIETLTYTLAKDPTLQIWKDLAQTVLGRAISLNKRRPEEAAKLEVKAYTRRSDWRQCNEDIAASLSPLERHLLKK